MRGKAQYMQCRRHAKDLIILIALCIAIVNLAEADIRPIPDPALTPDTIVVIPNNSSYDVVISGGDVGRFEGTSNTPFGSGGKCLLQSQVSSLWPINSKIVLSRNFDLPPGSHNLRVLLSVDNDFQVYINETEISSGMVTHDGCPIIDEFLLDAPDHILKEGQNQIRVVATDRGGQSYVNLRVLADVDPLADMAPFQSCESRYNPGLICEQSPISCRFLVVLEGASCTQYCESRGGRCLDAAWDVNDSCEYEVIEYEGILPCDDVAGDQICECSL